MTFEPRQRLPYFVRGDLDGFFGLLIDNLVNVMIIVSLCTGLLGMPPSLVFGRILPGAAVSILLGNLFYAWQARRVALRHGRDDVTALRMASTQCPSLPSSFSSCSRCIGRRGRGVGVEGRAAACFVSGLIEFLGAFIGERIRRMTPRAALLSTLAGIAVTFIAVEFAFKVLSRPLSPWFLWPFCSCNTSPG